MVHEELEVRLNDKEYKNWLKAGQCLLILRDGLHPFVDGRMRAFHSDVINQNTRLRKPCETSACKPRANQLSQVCGVCSLWKRVILSHHRQPDATVNWDNCSPPSWRSDHWELAKAYMPRGQGKVKNAHEYDTSALLNLINFCNYFSVDVKYVKEVIRHRNELMHSCDFRVKDDWMRRYHASLTHLVRQFINIPEMTRVEQQINNMMTVDLSIRTTGSDLMDSAAFEGLEFDSAIQLEISADLISQWEAELLQEKLQELLHAAADDGETRVRRTNIYIYLIFIQSHLILFSQLVSFGSSSL
ncbi:hypothetical protein PAMA_005394 [Pampus argenteus]